MRIRTVHKVLMLALFILYIISVLIVWGIGYSLWVALLWNLLTFIGADFPIDFSLADKPNALAFLSNVFGVIGSLILTILLTSFFYQMLSKINIREKVVMSRVKRLKGHFIITPANKIASYLVDEFKKNKLGFVVLDPSQKNIEMLIKEGVLAVKGDPLNIEALENANIKSAAALLLLNDDIVKNTLAALTAKRINNKIRIASRIKRVDELAKMKRVGINYIVMPEVAIGDELGNFLLRHMKK
ncbi:MAG: NAD(P)-binding protein [Candidatus Micrarchaeota archaeon]